MKKLVIALCLCLVPSLAVAPPVTAKKRVAKSTKKAGAPPLRANKGSQATQNRQADREDLTRLENDAQLERFKRAGLLVPLPKVRGLEVKDLDPEWQWCRPKTAEFLRHLAATHWRKFRRPLEITSAVRTAERQRELRGETANATQNRRHPSSHLTGATIDITKNGMTRQQILWMRRMLRPLHRKTIFVVEEFRQPCFHIMVYQSYQKPKGW